MYKTLIPLFSLSQNVLFCLHPQVMNTLKFALQPCISDIRLEWSLPYGVEVLQTPSVHPPIFQGEPLVVYGLLCDTVRMQSTLASVLLKGARRNPFTERALSRGSSNEKAEEDASSPTRPKSPAKTDNRGMYSVGHLGRLLSWGQFIKRFGYSENANSTFSLSHVCMLSEQNNLCTI